MWICARILRSVLYAQSLIPSVIMLQTLGAVFELFRCIEQFNAILGPLCVSKKMCNVYVVEETCFSCVFLLLLA